MNQILTTPDVKLFVRAVREHLSDLTEDEREELVGGLEGDMSDLVDERGVEALPEPAAYARELRGAAGFAPEAAPVATREALGPRVEALLDASHSRWRALVAGLPGGPWEVVVALRPAWWVLRAWLAVSLVDLVWGRGSTGTGLAVVPSLGPWGLPLLLVAVVGSVLVGLGRVWPGRGGVVARVVLLLLNGFAVLVTPLCLASYTSAADVEGWYDGEAVGTVEGLSHDGVAVTNVYPYDAQGRPLVGVQLVDQDGRRLPVAADGVDPVTGLSSFLTPWTNGRTEVFSTFPLPERRTDPVTGKPLGEPRLQTPPYASLPAVTLDGVTPTRTLTAAERRVLARAEARAERQQRAGGR